MEQPLSYLFQGNHGWGMDLGFVFEIKDPKQALGFKPEQNRYKLRAGVSILT
jgi:hypothetical protein